MTTAVTLTNPGKPDDPPGMLYYSPGFGLAANAGGISFSDPNVLADRVVTSVMFVWGKLLNGVQMTFKDHSIPPHVIQSQLYGGTDSGSTVFNLDADAGEYIARGVVRWGETVDGLGLVTNFNRKTANPQHTGPDGQPLVTLGGTGGGESTFDPGSGYEIVGFFGRFGVNSNEDDKMTVGQIGFIYRKRVG